MPNCDWYGTLSDHKPILEFLFNEKECEIYESYSQFEKPLKMFLKKEEILKEFSRTYKNGKKINAVNLELYVLGSGPKLVSRKIKLDPKSCNGAKYRYSVEGWGLVQFHLSQTTESRLNDSHTNHNSKKRAEKWALTFPEMDAPSYWNFDMINKFSLKLNRQIRKNYTGKITSRVVLSGAFKLWENGVSLFPFKKGTHEIKIRE